MSLSRFWLLSVGAGFNSRFLNKSIQKVFLDLVVASVRRSETSMSVDGA